MSQRPLRCSMCYFRAKSNRQLICHSLSYHKDEGSFSARCCVQQCRYTTNSWNAYKLHYRRNHPNINITDYLQTNLHETNNDIARGHSDSSENDQSDAESDIQWEDNNDQVTETCNMNRVLAKHFLSLETEYKVNKTALNSILTSTAFLVSNVIDSVLKDVTEAVVQHGICIPDEILKDVNSDSKTKVMTNLDNFQTSKQREKVYGRLPTMVRPQPVLMGQRTIKVKGKFQTQKCFAYCVPLKEQLEILLNMPEIWHFFKNPSTATNGYMSDVNDGSYVKNHPLHRDPRNFLKLALSFDDFELQNPLRSNSNHKVSMFYFQILNIPVEFRSKLKTIFLLATARAKYVQKFGLKRLLRDFIYTVNQLTTNGINFNIHGTDVVIHGCLLYCVADHPAASLIGGFKQSASFSFRSCRRCNASQRDMRAHFSEDLFSLRDMRSYLENCRILQDRNLSEINRQYWSKKFGINEQSVLCGIRGFPVTNNLVMDNCHVLLEGLLPNVVGLLLNVLVIQEQVFSLDFLNESLANFPYGYTDIGHLPEPIHRKHILTDYSVKQKAVAMMTLTFCLPLILGFVVPDGHRHYKHFINLVKITQLCFAPYVNMDSCGEMKTLIEMFGNDWVALYPGVAPKPKLHYLIHMVEQVKNFGSLRGVSALRFEGKHSWFKDQRLRNFKNIPFSLAHKHQTYMAHILMNMDGTLSQNFIYSGDLIGEGDAVTITNNGTVLYDFLVSEFGMQDRFIAYETDTLTIRGNKYKLGTVLLLGWDEMSFPLFGVIDQIVVFDEHKLFVINELSTLAYIWQLHSYSVSETNNYRAMRYTKLMNKFPLHKFVKNNHIFIMNKHAHFTGGPC